MGHIGPRRSSGRHFARVKGVPTRKMLTANERRTTYQINFSANCIWRDVVAVEVMTPAEEIGVPLAANKLVLLVATTGDAKLV